MLETSKKRCLTVGRRSLDLRPLSRDCSATFTKICPNCLTRPKNVVWQSTDGRVTSDHFRVTVLRLLKKKFLWSWNVQITLFDSRPTVAWPPTTVAWPFSGFLQSLSWLLETSEKRCLTVDRRSRDLRSISRDRSATFIKKFPNCSKRPKTLFDSRPTVAWPPTTVAWPFSDFFQIFSKCSKRQKNVVSQSADGRVTSDHSRVTVQCLSQKFFELLESLKSFVWQSADGRVTSDHFRVTVQWLFLKSFQIACNVQKRCLTVGRWSPDLRPLSRDRWATFSNCFQLPETSEILCLKISGRSRVCPATLLPCFFRTASHTHWYVVFLVLIPSFRRTARPRISSYRYGPILEMLTSYQS